jgi:hypothetical protein
MTKADAILCEHAALSVPRISVDSLLSVSSKRRFPLIEFRSTVAIPLLT